MSDALEKVREVLNCICDENFPDASDLKIKPISTDGANYSSVLFEASIVTPKETHELFAKVVSMGDILSDASQYILDAEKYMLATLSCAYEKLQDKHGIQTKLLFPKLYKSVDEVTVMENLAAKGYECYDRFKSINWGYASSSVEALAKFHAISFAFKNECPEEFIEAGKVLNLPMAVMKTFQFEGINDGAMAVVDEKDREILSKLLEGSKGLSKAMDLSEPRKTTVIVHGDYRPSNLMHKEVNGEYHVIPVDYQLARLGCPVSDLLYFIVLGSDQQFRKKYYHQLVNHYYEHLTLMMTELGLQPDEIYGKEEFESDMKAKLPIALSVAATLLPFVTVDPASAPNFEGGQFVPTPNELFGERFRELMQDLKQWGVI